MHCKYVYHEINGGGENDGVEAADERVGDQASDEREERGDTNPQVDVFSSGGDWLVKTIYEVHDQVSGYSIVRKPVCHLNNCMHICIYYFYNFISQDKH